VTKKGFVLAVGLWSGLLCTSSVASHPLVEGVKELQSSRPLDWEQRYGDVSRCLDGSESANKALRTSLDRAEIDEAVAKIVDAIHRGTPLESVHFMEHKSPLVRWMVLRSNFQPPRRKPSPVEIGDYQRIAKVGLSDDSVDVSSLAVRYVENYYGLFSCQEQQEIDGLLWRLTQNDSVRLTALHCLASLDGSKQNDARLEKFSGTALMSSGILYWWVLSIEFTSGKAFQR
jgi:hypothetical protein